MDRWVELGRAETAGGDNLVLRRCRDLFEIRCNGWELMSNRAHHSEEAMARLATARLATAAPRVLVAGLGMGFTLRAVLDALPADAQAVVAELLPEVIAWNRGPLAPLAARPLEDSRVVVRCCDVHDLLRASRGEFDLILMDVDNGPDHVMLPGNRSLYRDAGLRLIRAALRPAGLLAVWSAARSPPFEQRLRAHGLRWDAVDLPARGLPGDPMHTVYLATPAQPQTPP